MKLLELIDSYINYHSGSTNRYDKRDSATIRIYKNKGDMVGAFLLQLNLLDLRAKEFGPKMADVYLEHLSAKNYEHNYVARCVHFCKSVLKYGVRKELIQFNPLSEYSIRKDPPAKPVHLTPDELKRIIKYRPYTSTLKKARDMFLFQCHTGMDYGDTVTVNKSHILSIQGCNLIIKPRNKTGVEAVIPYNNVAREIFERNGWCLDLLSNAGYNVALKSLAKECEIDKHLTTHIGRKTYAMIELNYYGREIGPLSKRLGHKRIATTEETYAQVEIIAVIRDIMMSKTLTIGK